VITQVVLFLELSGDEIVDNDAAVNCMEQIAVTLQSLSSDERMRFVEYLHERAESLAPGDERECIRAMPRNLGLLNE
jgi:hypothetical protein